MNIEELHISKPQQPYVFQGANGHNTTQTKMLVKDIWKATAAGDSALLGRLITSHASRKSIKKSNLQNGLSYTHYLSINILRAISN